MRKSCMLSALVFLAVLSGCGGGGASSETDQTVIEFDLSKDPQDIFSLGILEEPVFFNLASDSILIGEIVQAVNFEDHIYLLGEDGGRNSITMVDMQGRLVGRVERTGRGPLEYIGLNTIFADRKKGLIGAYSRQDQKIIYVSPDGLLLSERKMPKWFTEIYETPWGYAGDMDNYAQDRAHSDNLWLMDSAFVLGDSFFDISESWESNSVRWKFPFSSYGDKTYFTRLMDYNIYSVGEDGVTAPYRFDFGRNNWPEPDAGPERSRQINMESPGHYVSRFYRFQETDSHIIVQFLHEGQYRLGIYDKISGESEVCSLEPYTGKYLISFGSIVGMDSEAIYTIIEARSIKRIWNGRDAYNDFEADYPDQIRRLREDFPKIDELGNPFLAVYRFKSVPD